MNYLIDFLTSLLQWASVQLRIFLNSCHPRLKKGLLLLLILKLLSLKKRDVKFYFNDQFHIRQLFFQFKLEFCYFCIFTFNICNTLKQKT